MMNMNAMNLLLLGSLLLVIEPAHAHRFNGIRRQYGTSNVNFGVCKEMASGTVLPLASLQSFVPDSVSVLSMTEQGFVFDGSDVLGQVLVRTVECDFIEVESNGRTRKEYNRRFAHVGTPFDSSTFPATPFNNDGQNGGDFNNYIFSYYTDSKAYYHAMRRSGIRGAAMARITYNDESTGDCMIRRSVSVSPFQWKWWKKSGGFGYDASSTEIPDPSCSDPDTPYIANWWSADDRTNTTSVLSNTIPAQVALSPAGAVVTITPNSNGDGLKELIGADETTSTAFSLFGYLPEAEGLDMVVLNAGAIME